MLSEHFKYSLLILFAVAFIATSIVYRPILKIAKSRHILDNPEDRKLQKQPVPVMGGIAVFFGIAVGVCVSNMLCNASSLYVVLGVSIVMLYLGFIDDVVTIRAWQRFLLELAMGFLLTIGLRYYIADFQGMWGVGYLPLWLGLVLSSITFVGIINAINMIDGVDGLSSAFSILIMVCLGIVCFLAHDFSFAALAAIFVGALLPFFFHNVFGLKSKMYVGDGGTMMTGTVISALVFTILRRNNPILSLESSENFSRVAFCLAVMSIPIADCLRVMFGRMLHGRSPFLPDKTHLHHYLFSIGYSHIAITAIEIALNLAVIVIFLAAWLLGASFTIQLLIVILSAGAADLGIVLLIKEMQKRNSALYKRLQKRAEVSHFERKGIWLKIQKFIGGKD